MSTAVQSQDPHPAVEPSYLVSKRGLMSWLVTVDHKRLGLMYLASVMFFFLIAGILAIALRTELFTPDQDFMSAQTYNQVFTLHGAIMVFLFIIPSVPAALGNFLLPLMLGAKDVAFPRLNLLSFYVYSVAAVFLIVAILTSGLDTGWTFYTPYSTSTGTAVITATAGVFIAGFSSILTGLNFVVTVHKMRAPGMNWNRMPLFVWAIYSTAVIQVLATPVLAITLLLLIIERSLGIGIFDPAMGGDPVLFQHFFWFYSHPAVYIMILPGFGIISEIIPTFSRKPLFGYQAMVYATASIAFLSFIVWAHHMFTVGMPLGGEIYFMFATMLIAVPTGVKVFNWVSTMWRGSISFESPMLWSIAFVVLFTIGGFSGLMLAIVPADFQYHDTYFVVAHFHYVLVTGALFAIIAAVYYWWPKWTGRMYNETWAKFHFWWTMVFVNLLFFPQHFLGLAGMPRRIPDYNVVFADWNLISSIGAFGMFVTPFMMFFVLWHSLKHGAPAAARSWDSARGLEWTVPSPAPHHTFGTPPVLRPGDLAHDDVAH